MVTSEVTITFLRVEFKKTGWSQKIKGESMKNTGKLNNDEMLDELREYLKRAELSNKERNRAERIIKNIQGELVYYEEFWMEYDEIKKKVNLIITESLEIEQIFKKNNIEFWRTELNTLKNDDLQG
jgi:hypothetical protein